MPTMRSKFKTTVEAARIRKGPMASSPGDTFGAFDFKRPGGRLHAIVSDGADSGWDHVSVSNRKRDPTWSEMCWVKDLFFHPDEAVIQFHPAIQDYVNYHANCLHLWRPTTEKLLAPPPELIGPGRKGVDDDQLNSDNLRRYLEARGEAEALVRS